MDKMSTKETLNRMKSLMKYGLQTESKKTDYSAIEYQKEGADGNVYAIIREGTKYYIKSAPKKNNLLKEDFNYIGGFRNRKDYEYSSYAGAQKNFDLKMMSLREAYDNRNFNVESWNLDKKENVVVENSEKMKKEILREHQIMKNTMAISENQDICCDGPKCTGPKCQKNNIKKVNHETGDPNNVTDGFSEEVGKEFKKQGKPNITAEAKEVLGWNRKNKDYMDKSHGTEIGDSAPFDAETARNIDDDKEPVTRTGEMKNGVVENHHKAMHVAQNQNTPEPGNGEGPSDDNNDPFNDKKGRQIDEAIDDDFDDDVEDTDVEGGEEDMDGADFGAEDFEGEDDIEGEDFGAEEMPDEDDSENEYDLEVGDDEEDDDIFEDDLESRVSAMEDLLGAIADKLGVDEPEVDEEDYEDDDLFDGIGDDEDMDDEDMDDEDFEDEDYEDEDMDDEDFEDEDEDMPMESRRRRGVQVVETKNYRRAIRRMMNEEGMKPFSDAGRVPANNMNKLDDFGKHPAYQKTVMSLPPKDFQEFPGYYDMNDDSVRNDDPYGEKIGDGAPFEIDPDSIDNAIAESINRLKKKSNRR